MQKGEPKGPRSDKVTQPRAKKNRVKWCGGHEGRKHTPKIVLSTRWSRGPCQRPPYWWFEARSGRKGYTNWWCHHEEACSKCGRIMRYFVDVEECPDYKAAA